MKHPVPDAIDIREKTKMREGSKEEIEFDVIVPLVFI